MSFTKYILPVVAGAIAAMMLIMLGERYLSSVFPLPQGIDPTNRAALEAAMGTMPDKVFILLLANYMVASFIAGSVATLVAKRESARPAVVVGIVLTLAGLANLISIPHPIWFSVINVLSYLPFSYLGYIALRGKPAEA